MKQNQKIGLVLVIAVAAIAFFGNYFAPFGLPSPSMSQAQLAVTGGQTTQQGQPVQVEQCQTNTAITPAPIGIAKYKGGSIITAKKADYEVAGTNAWTTNADLNVTGLFAPKTTYDILWGYDTTGTGSSDYYAEEFTINSGCTSPLSFSRELTQEGGVNVTAYNQNGVTANANSTGASASVVAGQTYSFGVRLDENTAYGAFGNPTSAQKVMTCIDYNNSDLQRIELIMPDGTMPSSIGGAPPIHPTLDANNSNTICFNTPQLWVANSGSINQSDFKIRITCNSGQACAGTEISLYHELNLHFYDYTKFYDSQGNAIKDMIYDPSDNTDVGASQPAPTTLYYY